MANISLNLAYFSSFFFKLSIFHQYDPSKELNHLKVISVVIELDCMNTVERKLCFNKTISYSVKEAGGRGG